MVSPICQVKDGSGSYTSTTNGVNVTAGNTITIKLYDVSGVKTWSIQCISTDDNHVAATITSGLTVNQTTKTATFTAPADSSSLIFKSIVNGGVDNNGVIQPSYSTTLGVYILTAGALRVGAVGETTEGSASFGWTTKINSLIRSAISSTAPTTGDLMQWNGSAWTPVPVQSIGSLLPTPSSLVLRNAFGNIIASSDAGATIANYNGSGITFSGATDCVIKESLDSSSSGKGHSLFLSGQSMSSPFTVGGDLDLNSGSGISSDGDVNISGNVINIISDGVGSTFSSSNLSLGQTNVLFDSAVTAPVFGQDDSFVNSATGHTLTIHAADMLGTAVIGSSLVLRAGTGDNGSGNVDISGSMLNVTAGFSVNDVDGSGITLSTSGGDIQIVGASGIGLVGDLFLTTSSADYSATVTPNNLAKGPNLVLNGGGSILAGSTGGDVTLVPAAGVSSVGNIGLGAAYGASTGAKCVFIANATVAPSTNPTGGGVLYVEAGALKYRSSNGTVTTIGPL